MSSRSLVKTMWLLSGDQLGAKSSVALVVRRLSTEPLGVIDQISSRSTADSDSPEKAMRVPSGDQAGRPALRKPVVMRVGDPPLTGTVNSARPPASKLAPSLAPSPPTPST